MIYNKNELITLVTLGDQLVLYLIYSAFTLPLLYLAYMIKNIPAHVMSDRVQDTI